MRPECGFAFVNLVQEEVVRIVRQHEDIELKTAAIPDRRCGVFCDGLKKLVAFRDSRSRAVAPRRRLRRGRVSTAPFNKSAG